MRTLLVAVLCSSIAFADAPDAGSDAPLADPDAQGRVLVIDSGATVTMPFRAACLDSQEDVRRTRALTRAETKVKDYETGNTIMPTSLYVAITGGAVGVAIGVTLGLLAGTGHLK